MKALQHKQTFFPWINVVFSDVYFFSLEFSSPSPTNKHRTKTHTFPAKKEADVVQEKRGYLCIQMSRTTEENKKRKKILAKSKQLPSMHKYKFFLLYWVI